PLGKVADRDDARSRRGVGILVKSLDVIERDALDRFLQPDAWIRTAVVAAEEQEVESIVGDRRRLGLALLDALQRLILEPLEVLFGERRREKSFGGHFHRLGQVLAQASYSDRREAVSGAECHG